MIGRFASRLGSRLPGQLVAGLILTLLGLWFATEPWRHGYPVADDLVAIEAAAKDAVEIRKRRGAVLRFLVPDPLEVHAVLEPDLRAVRYPDTLPRYEDVKRALASGPATFHLWEDAAGVDDATLVWRLDVRGATLFSLEETVGALKRLRLEAAWLPAGIAVFGLAIVALTLHRRGGRQP